MQRGLILVADEDHRTYNLLSQLLDSTRYELVQSARDANVVGVARTRTPSVIFLSAETAHVDEICDNLKNDAQLARIPLVLLERAGAERPGGDGAAKADYFLTKPLKLQTLAPALSRLMPDAVPLNDGPPPLETVELDDADFELTTEPPEAAPGPDDIRPALPPEYHGADGEPAEGSNAITAFLRELDRSQSLYKQKIDRLQAELAEARREVRRLTEERQRAFDAAEAAHIEKEAVMERLGEEIVEREKTGRSLEQLLRGAIMERSVLEAEVKVVIDRISGMRDELQQAQEDAVGRIEAVRDEYQSVLEQHMEDSEREREALEERARAAQLIVEAEQRRIAELTAELEDQRAGDHAIRETETALQSELQAARAALEVVIGERDAVREELRSAEAAIEETQKAGELWQAQAEVARTHAAQSNAAIGALRDQEAAAAAAGHEDLIASLEARVAELQVELEARALAALEAQAQLDALRARAGLLDMTEAALEEALEAVQRTEAAARTAAAERDLARTERDAAVQRAATVEQLNAESQTALEAATAAHRGMGERASELETKLKEQGAAAERAGTARAAELSAALERSTAALETAQADQARRQAQLTQSLARVQELGSEQLRLTQQIAGLEDLLSNAMDEAQSARAELVTTVDRLSDRERTVAELEQREQELVEALAATEGLRQALEATTQEAELLRADLGESEQRASAIGEALEDAQRQARAAEASRQELDRAATEMRERAAELDQERERLSGRTAALEAQIALLDDELRARGSEIEGERARHEAELAALRKEVAQTAQDAAQAVQIANERKAAAARATEDAAQARLAMAELQAELHVESQGRQHALAALDALQAGIDEARAAHARAADEATAAQEQLELQRAAASRIEDQLQAERTAAEERLQAAVQQAREQAERSVEERLRRESDLALQEERAEATAQLRAAEETLQSQTARSKAALEEQEAALEAARTALKALREEHDAAVSQAHDASTREDEARADAEVARVGEQRARADAESHSRTQIDVLRKHNARLEQQVALLEAELQDLRSMEYEAPVLESASEQTVNEPLAVASAIEAAASAEAGEELVRMRATLDEVTRDRNSLNMQLRTMRLSLDESRNRAKELEGALRDLSRSAAIAPPPPPGSPSAEQEETTARMRKELRGASESIRMCLLELEQSRDRLEHGRREIVAGREGLAQLFSDWQKLESLLREMAQDPAVRPALAKLASVLKDVRAHVRETRGILEHGEQLVRAQDELTTSLYRVLTRTVS